MTSQNISNIRIEDTIVLELHQLFDLTYIEWFKYHFLGYVVRENVSVCNLGIPYIENNEKIKVPTWLIVFMKGLPCKSNLFYYFDLTIDCSISKLRNNFPEIQKMGIVYFRAMEQTDWNMFLSSIWEFARNGTDIKLLNTNIVLNQSNPYKKINGLILRGVGLGFYGVFEKKWYQSENRLVEKLASLNLVDFWITNNFDITDVAYQKEKMLKQLYQHIAMQ